MRIIPKYQEGNLVARQDNTRVTKPSYYKPVKQKLIPKPQPQFVQDNRSQWQHEQGSKKADVAYAKQIKDRKTEEGLRNLNGFLTFTDYVGLATGVGSLASKGLIWGGKKLVKRSANKLSAKLYPTYNPRVNLNPDGTWNTNKIHSSVETGTNDAIDFLGSKLKQETDQYNTKLANRLGYKYFTPYTKGAERASVNVNPDYKSISFPNSGYAGQVSYGIEPSKDILKYNMFYDLHPTAYHETLHRGFYGRIPQERKPSNMSILEHSSRVHDTKDFYDLKAKKLLAPKSKVPSSETHDYLMIEGEAATNTMELGKRLGLTPGQEYPGRKELSQMLESFSKSGNEHAYMPNYLDMKHPKRVWNALTGKYFTYPAVGTTLIGTSNDRNDL